MNKILKYTKHKECGVDIIYDISIVDKNSERFLYWSNLGYFEVSLTNYHFFSNSGSSVDDNDIQYCLDYLKIESRTTKINYLKNKINSTNEK